MATLFRRLLGLHVHNKGEAPHQGFGARDIGVIGSLCLVCNNIIGPGLFALPGLFQQSGWIPCMIVLTLTSVWTTQSALYLSRTMASFAGNSAFSQRLEMSRVAYELLPRWGYYLMVFTVTCTFYTQNLANIILSAQSMDATVLDLAGKVCAFDYTTFQPVCISKGDKSGDFTDSVFGSAFVVSMGYGIVLLVCIPLSIMNLDDNIGIQIGGFLLTLGCMGVWLANFCSLGLQPSFMPAFGSGASNFLPLLPTIIFNYGFVATIPSWLNEKHPNVSVSRTIIFAQMLATTQLLILAIFGGLSIYIDDASISITTIMNRSNHPAGIWHLSQIMTFIFPVANILTSIPVFCIIIRYNLLQFHGFKIPVWIANLFAVVSPWLVALPFFPGNSLSLVINWSSALLFVLMNMILPIWMYLKQENRRVKGEPRIVLEEEGTGGVGGSGVVGGDEGESSSRSGNSLTTSLLGNTQTGGGNGLALLLADEQRAAEEALVAEMRAAVAAGGKKGGASGAAAAAFLSLNRGAGVGGGTKGADAWSYALPSDQLRGGEGGDDYDFDDGEDEEEEGARIHALPPTCVKHERMYAYILLGLALILSTASLGLQIFSVADPSPDSSSDDDGGNSNATAIALSESWLSAVKPLWE